MLVSLKREGREIMEIETRAQIAYKAMKDEGKLWENALRNVRCILPDDAVDVEEEVKRLRRAEVERLSEIARAYSLGDPAVSKIQ